MNECIFGMEFPLIHETIPIPVLVNHTAEVFVNHIKQYTLLLSLQLNSFNKI